MIGGAPREARVVSVLCALSAGRLGTTTRQVPSSASSYDQELAAALWDLSADTAGLPRVSAALDAPQM